LGNSVGMAIASRWLAAHFQQTGISTCSISMCLRYAVMAIDGRRFERSRVDSWSSEAFQFVLDLRRQSHHD